MCVCVPVCVCTSVLFIWHFSHLSYLYNTAHFVFNTIMYSLPQECCQIIIRKKTPVCFMVFDVCLYMTTFMLFYKITRGVGEVRAIDHTEHLHLMRIDVWPQLCWGSERLTIQNTSIWYMFVCDHSDAVFYRATRAGCRCDSPYRAPPFASSTLTWLLIKMSLSAEIRCVLFLDTVLPFPETSEHLAICDRRACVRGSNHFWFCRVFACVVL